MASSEQTQEWAAFYRQAKHNWNQKVARSANVDQKVQNGINWIKSTKKQYITTRTNTGKGDVQSKCYIVWKVADTKCYQGTNKKKYNKRK